MLHVVVPECSTIEGGAKRARGLGQRRRQHKSEWHQVVHALVNDLLRECSCPGLVHQGGTLPIAVQGGILPSTVLLGRFHR